MQKNDKRIEALRLQDVSLAIGQTQILSNLSFSLAAGEMHALVGKYAEGKSTLCSVVSGNIKPDHGSLIVAGRRYSGLTMKRASALGIEKVSDHDHSFPQLTVEEEIGIGKFRRLNRYWFGRYALSRRIREWLSELGIQLDLERRLSDMQSEECLFVSLLARLFCRPKLLVLDETLERISQARLNLILPILTRYRNEGMAILWATHNLELAWSLADNISLIRSGRLVLTESPNHIDRRSLLYLAYSEKPDFDWQGVSTERFQNLIRYTEAVLRDLPTAIAIFDMDEVVQFVNSRGRIFFIGNSLPEKSQSLDDLIGTENHRLIDMVRQCREKGSDQRYHSMLFLASFGECLIDAQTRIIRDGDIAIGVMIIIEDVSERENLRRNLMLANNLSSVGLLAAGVAHEVNNPLAIISNYISFLLRRTEPSKERETILGIREEIGRIQEIVNNLVAFSGRRATVSSRVDLHATAQELADLLGYNYKDRNTEFVLIEPDQPAEIVANANEVRQMFINLFRNSIEAMPGGGTITISFTSVDDNLAVSIIDTGQG
ncbi:MAG: ATP-binding cassette domain-containing protein, partial [Planctomycetes bacterium]|nr:ATP-binding cassette domain-containing protein [Planctomycetota bacterium]